MSNILLTSDANLEITAEATSDGKPKLKSFSMVAYSGKPMQIVGYYRPVVVDLSGVTVLKQSTPILFAHDPDRIVGHSDSIKVAKNQIIVAGKISGTGTDAEQVISLSSNGFPWQASIGCSVENMEFVDTGSNANVNGANVSGPVYIARKTSLREVSFVALGADANTSATVSATKGQTMSATSTIEANQPNEVILAERNRIAKIEATCKGNWGNQAARVAEIKAQAINEEIRIEAMQAELLGCLRASRPNFSTSSTSSHPTMDRQFIEASLLLRAGREKTAIKYYGERMVEAASKRRLSLKEAGDECIRIEGREVPTGTEAGIKAAFSTETFTNALSNTVGRALIEPYIELTASWRAFALIKSAVDFRPQSGIRPSAFESMEEVAPDGEIKHTPLGEDGLYSWQVRTWGKMFGVNRQTIINDDIGLFDTTNFLWAQSGARSLNDLIWTTIIGAQAASWYATGNNNLMTTGSALSITTLSQAVTKMRKQTDKNGNTIDMMPVVLAVCPELEYTARAILNSAEILTIASETTPSGNPMAGIVPTLVVEPRMSNTKFTGNSVTAWNLFAGPMANPITVGFLNGQQTPTVEVQEADFKKLGIQMRIYHDFGVALGDPKASVKATGAA